MKMGRPLSGESEIGGSAVMVASATDIDADGVPSASQDEDDEEGAMMLQMLMGGDGEAEQGEAVLQSNFVEEWDTDMRVHLARCESGSAMDFMPVFLLGMLDCI